MKRAIKILFFTLLALILLPAAILICTVRVLTPDVLTPVVQKIANDFVDGDVNIGRLELSFKPAFPILNVQLDSLTVISHALDDLDANSRAQLPAYTDTLLTLGSFSGSLNLRPLLRGEISVEDVTLERPGINIVLAGEGRNNFNIFPSDSTATDTASTPTVIPPFSLRHFTLKDPQAIRFFNAVDSTDATILLLAEAGVDGTRSPEYRLNIEGRLRSPLMQSIVSIDDLHLGLDGRVRWNPRDPGLITIEEFRMRGADLSVTVDASTVFDRALTVNSARVVLDPIGLETLAGYLTPEMRKEYGLTPGAFVTDATIAMEAEITRPFNLDTDSIPYARVNVTVPESRLQYGQAKFHNFRLDLGLDLRGNNPDSARVNLRKFTISGPATDLDLTAEASELVSDPAFSGCLKGHTDISRLPAKLLELAQGYVSGRLDMDFDFDGRLSMLDKDSFHRLDLRGEVTGSKLYYLSADTATMAQVDRAQIRFGTNTQLTDTASGRKSGRLLSGKITVDSANVLTGGVNITLNGLSLGVATQNMPPSADTTLVVPMGGALKVDRFAVFNITDTAGMNLRRLTGSVSMTRHKGEKHLPEFRLKLNAGRLSAGDRTTRLMLSSAAIDANMHKIPARKSKAAEAVRHLADSLTKVYPNLPADSVLRLAIEKRRHRPGEHRQRRVHSEMTAADNEIIDWGTSTGFRKFLLGWDLSGTISTRSARLFTPLFPVRNRISHLDIRFSNDSVILTDVKYKAGHSDLTINGQVSYIKRAFTSLGYRSAVKVNFDIFSDTVDVNEIAAATFAGAAYSERLRRGETSGLATDSDDDDLDDEMDALMSEHPDSVGPLLIPTNIDANVNLRASNILYSDLLLKGLRGEIMVFDGGVNLHNFRAASDVGALDLTALYSAPSPSDMKFGFGLQVERFNVERFLTLMPTIDSIIPLMRDFSGIINADVAATVDIDSAMNFVLPSLEAAVRLQGDSLTIIDADTYKMLGKWLRFKDKSDNTIKEMNVELTVHDNVMHLYPFMFNIDRYRLGVQGYNDLAMNFDYHIAVLKSPLPFKFGITVKGNPDKFKVRFGGAKFKEGQVFENVGVVDTARINLLGQIENVFRRGVKNSRFATLKMPSTPPASKIDLSGDTLSHADSLMLIREGILPAPPEVSDQSDMSDPSGKSASSKKKKKK